MPPSQTPSPRSAALFAVALLLLAPVARAQGIAVAGPCAVAPDRDPCAGGACAKCQPGRAIASAPTMSRVQRSARPPGPRCPTPMRSAVPAPAPIRAPAAGPPRTETVRRSAGLRRSPRAPVAGGDRRTRRSPPPTPGRPQLRRVRAAAHGDESLRARPAPPLAAGSPRDPSRRRVRRPRLPRRRGRRAAAAARTRRPPVPPSPPPRTPPGPAGSADRDRAAARTRPAARRARLLSSRLRFFRVDNREPDGASQTRKGDRDGDPCTESRGVGRERR